MSQETILIVDDDPSNLRVLLDSLEKIGLKVLVALQGEVALQTLGKVQPDLILLDVMMPGMDGFETCRRLKANPATRDIPVMFMTALTDTVDEVLGLTLGAVDYIAKPFQMETVLARIRTQLAVRQMQKRLAEQNTILQQEIAERQRAEEQLRAAHQELQVKNDELQALNASKDKFFSIIAHDLRSPFTALLAYIELMNEQLERLSPTKIKDYLGKLRLSADRLYALLENLLTWSRIHRGVMEYRPEPLALQEIAANTVMLFSSNAERKQLTLQSLLPDRIAVYADYAMVNTVLRNLVSNALKFTAPGGQIAISAGQDERVVTVAVRDTGAGMRPEDIQKVFRLDVKYSTVGTAGETGTGLGLLLCHDLVQKNGGQIWLESVLGQGTTFWFTLPRQAPDWPVLQTGQSD